MTQISIFHQEYQQRVKKKRIPSSIIEILRSSIIETSDERLLSKEGRGGKKKSPITKRIRNERGESISHSLRKTNGISPRVAPLLEREQTAAARSNSRCIYAIKKARMHVGTWGELIKFLPASTTANRRRSSLASTVSLFFFFFFSFTSPHN